MPEKTDAEWQALVDRIAREIMSLLTWDDLTAAEQQSYIDVVPKQFLDMSMGEWKRSYWKRECGHVFTVDHCSGWQPQNHVTQAIEARDRIASHGFDWCISRWAGAPQIQVLFMRGSEHYDGYADTGAKAICLAIEKFMEESC